MLTNSVTINESARSSETSVTLGVSGAGVGLDVLSLDAGARASGEMSLGLAHGWAAEEQGVGARGGLHDELVNSDAGATSLDNAGTGTLSEAESGDLELGQLQKSHVVSDSSDNDSSSGPIAVREERS